MIVIKKKEVFIFMDILHKILNGTLYYLNCNFLADIQYKRESPDTIILFFSGEAPEEFPQKFFLMPEGRKYDYRAFIFTLTEEFHICCAPEEDICFGQFITR